MQTKLIPLTLLAINLCAQEAGPDKFLSASDGEVIGILAQGKQSASLTGTIKRLNWTAANGKTIVLSFEGGNLTVEGDVQIYYGPQTLEGRLWTNHFSASTNVLVINAADFTNWFSNLYPIITNGLAKDLAKDMAAYGEKLDAELKLDLGKIIANGTFCRLRGHQWESAFNTINTLAFYNPNPKPTRHCSICGLTQTQDIGPWK